MESKICKDCQTEKPVSEFYKQVQSKNSYQSYCKSCHYARTKEPAKWAQIKKLYGIDRADYEQMMKEQRGVCKICGTTEADHRKFLSVDHDHKTGQVRGLLCHSCNIGLGKFRDNENLLKLAIVYLQDFKNMSHH